MAWLLEQVSFTMTARIRGDDGLTAYQRVRGRAFNMRVPSFDEKVRYKHRSKEMAANGDLRDRWGQGIFLGIHKATGQYVIHFENEIIHAGTVMALPDANKWDKYALESLRITPQSLHVPKEPEVVFPTEPGGVEVREPDGSAPTARKL